MDKLKEGSPFYKGLVDLINSEGVDSELGVADYVLAQYICLSLVQLVVCLSAISEDEDEDPDEMPTIMTSHVREDSSEPAS